MENILIQDFNLLKDFIYKFTKNNIVWEDGIEEVEVTIDIKWTQLFISLWTDNYTKIFEYHILENPKIEDVLELYFHVWFNIKQFVSYVNYEYNEDFYKI